MMPTPLCSYRSCETLELGQAHLSKQASQVLPDVTARDNSDNDTELLILKGMMLFPHTSTGLMISNLIFLSDPFVPLNSSVCIPLAILKTNVSFHYQLNSYLVRIGPSASESGRAHDPLMGLVANLTQVKAALRDPSVREVVSNIAPQLLEIFPADDATDADVEVRNAVAGLPSSSKPASPVTPSPPPPVESPVEPLAETKPAKPAFTPLPEKPAGEVNSATHRAAHARLVRRMEKTNPASFPNMTKLWNGNRKDILGSLKKIVFQMVFANGTTVPHCP